MSVDPNVFDLDEFSFPLGTDSGGGTDPVFDGPDYHANCRDAVRAAMETALGSYTAFQNDDLSWRIVTADDIGNYDVTRLESMPCVVVAAVAPVTERREFATNLQSGFSFPVVCALFAAGVANGEKSPSIPDPTMFRQIIINTFNLKRLSGVAQVGYCEVGEAGGQLFNKQSPAWQRLSAAMVVQCIGRFPRS